MYHPTLGRFVTLDPIGIDAGDVNLYRVEGNNPTNNLDPSGLLWVSAVAGTLPLLPAAQPPKEPKLPTSKTLSWNDYKKVKSGDSAAFTAGGLHYNVKDIKTASQAQGCDFIGSATLQVKFRAEFNPKDSYVMDGKASPALLKHERLHLAITEYVAEKANRNFTPNPFTAKGKGNTAKDAEENAQSNLVRVFEANHLADIRAALGAIQKSYDDETNHGKIEKAQKDWEINYMQKIDDALKKSKLKWEK